MPSPLTLLLLVGAGIALVLQNLTMLRLNAGVSSVFVTLALNSAVGLVLLLSLVGLRGGVSGLSEIVGAFRPLALTPGVFGTFFVFAGLYGYQKVGAAATVSVLVASQLVAGLAADWLRADAGGPRPGLQSALGAALLIGGAVLILRERA